MKSTKRFLLSAAFAALAMSAQAQDAKYSDNVIRIGVLMPISGPGSYFGRRAGRHAAGVNFWLIEQDIRIVFSHAPGYGAGANVLGKPLYETDALAPVIDGVEGTFTRLASVDPVNEILSISGC